MLVQGIYQEKGDESASIYATYIIIQACILILIPRCSSAMQCISQRSVQPILEWQLLNHYHYSNANCPYERCSLRLS